MTACTNKTPMLCDHKPNERGRCAHRVVVDAENVRDLGVDLGEAALDEGVELLLVHPPLPAEHRAVELGLADGPDGLD